MSRSGKNRAIVSASAADTAKAVRQPIAEPSRNDTTMPLPTIATAIPDQTTALTSGRGRHSEEFSHYEDVPAELTQKILAERAKRNGNTHD